MKLFGKDNPNYKNAGERKCIRCCKIYYSYNKKRKYCSHTCADISNRKIEQYTGKQLREIRRASKLKKIYNCSICGVVEVKRKSKYCKSCRILKNKIITTCKICKKQILSYRYRVRVYCSKLCRYIGLKGNGNPNYIDGRNPINKSIRNSKEYKNWRESVFRRDNYTCVWCGKVGWTLHADHIKPFSKYPDLRLELSNGRTLCKHCHEQTPTYKNKKSISEFHLITK